MSEQMEIDVPETEGLNEYYTLLEREVNEEKEKNTQRSDKKKITCITKDVCRRSTYSRRSKSLVLAAKEIKVQTHCNIGVIVTPNWEHGKIHTYKTKTVDKGNSTSNKENTTDQSSSLGYVSSSSLNSPPSPQRTYPTVRPALKAKALIPSSSKSSKKTSKRDLTQLCRVCGTKEELSFWLGCSYTHPKTRRQDCQYWVHQNCLNLYYKTRKELEKVPYYCKKHAPIHKKK